MKIGRPPKYDNPEELQKAIEDYFKNGINVVDKIVGDQVVKVPVPTITGLVLHCGFESRQSFYTYEKIPNFSYTIKKARTFIEKHYEELLQTGNTTGAIFALKNFSWSDKTEIEHSGDIRSNVVKVEVIGNANHVFPDSEEKLEDAG